MTIVLNSLSVNLCHPHHSGIPYDLESGQLYDSSMFVLLEGNVCGKSAMRTWCMQPIPCTFEQLQRVQRTRHRPVVKRVVSLPLDRQYNGQVEVGVTVVDLYKIFVSLMVFL